MDALFKKLNYKDQAAIWIINPPPSFQPALDGMNGVASVHGKIGKSQEVSFALAFATTKQQVDRFAADAGQACLGDAVVWVAYPKGTSKRYKCDFNRDTGWDALGANGFEPVRQVAIDEDWSALRFRRVEFIKTMSRSSAITAAGRDRLQAHGNGRQP